MPTPQRKEALNEGLSPHWRLVPRMENIGEHQKSRGLFPNLGLPSFSKHRTAALTERSDHSNMRWKNSQGMHLTAMLLRP